MSYRASRTKLLEAVKVWKESELGQHFYRPVSERLESADSNTGIRAPWLPEVSVVAESEEDTFQTPIRSRWLEEEAESFGDYAESLDLEGVSEMIESIGGDEQVVEAVLAQLEENEGNVMVIAHEGSTEGYALAFSKGTYYGSHTDIEEGDLLDEGLISMYFLARNVPDQNAPIVPGFPMIESQNSLFETLHSSVVLLNTMRENESADPEFIAVIEAFNNDLAAVIAELSIDEESLSESELALVVETFTGTFAGINEESVILASA